MPPARSAVDSGVDSCDDQRLSRTASFSLDLSPRKVLRWVLAAAAVLTATSVAGQVLVREAPSVPLAGGIAHRLHVDSEQSLPTIFSVLLIGAVAALLASIAVLHRRTGSRDSWYWATAAALALLLALDEYLSLHEQLVEPVRAALGSGPAGLLHYAWVVPGVGAVLVTSVVFMPFLRRLPTRLRHLVLVSGSLYLAGALCMESVGGALENAAGDRGSYGYVAATTLEETLEVLGVAVLLYALLEHVANAFDAVTVRAGLRHR